MQPASVAFASVCAGTDLIVDNELTLALPSASQYDDVPLAVESIQLQRSMITTAPQQTRMWTGYPSVSATIVMSGLLTAASDSLTAEELLNPYNPASPIYRELLLGVAVKVRAGLWVGDAVAELLDQFTGTIDSYDLDPLNGTVTLNCLDAWSTLTDGPNFLVTPTNPYHAIINNGGEPVELITRPGLTNLYVIDKILRDNGIHASPDQRAGCVLYAPLAGSALPTVFDPRAEPMYGATSATALGLVASTIRDMVWVPGKFSGQVPRDYNVFAGINRFTSETISDEGVPQIDLGRGWLYECWHRFDPALDWTDNDAEDFNLPRITTTLTTGLGQVTHASPGDEQGLGDFGTPPPARTQSWTVRANVNALGGPDRGAEWVFVPPSGIESTLPGVVDGTWQQLTVVVAMQDTTHARFEVYLDGVLQLTVVDVVAAVGLGFWALNAEVLSTLPGESLNITNESTGVPLSGFAPRAVLDASLNPLHALIDTTNMDAGTLLQLCADSEFAAVGFDESELFRLQNRETLRDTALGPDILSATNLLDVQPSVQSATAANVVEVPITNVAISEFGPLYVGPDQAVIRVGAGWTLRTYEVQTSDVVTCVSPFIFAGGFPIAGYDGFNLASGCRYAHSVDGTSVPTTSLIDMEAWQSGPNSLSYTLRNKSRLPMYLVTPQTWGYHAGEVGSPFFAIAGRVVSFAQGGSSAGGGPPTVSLASGTGGSGSGSPTAISGSAPGVAPARASWVRGGAHVTRLSLAANALVQDADTAQTLADDVLADVIYPRPVLQNVSVIADPRRQLGDRCRVVDIDTSRISDDAVVVADSIMISALDWTQQPTLRAVAQPGYWVAGEQGKSELAVTTWT